MSNDYVNHYARLEGFTVYSLTNISSQLLNSLREVLGSYVARPVGLVSSFLLLLLAGIAAPFIRRFAQAGERRDAPRSDVVVAFLMAAAAVFWGPVGVVTSIAPRYVATPAMLALASIIAGTLLFAQRSAQLQAFARAAFLFLALFSVAATHQASITQFRPAFNLEDGLAEALRQEADAWERGAQIVVVTDQAPSGFTNSYPHWSTWFVRYATSRPDVLACPASSSWANFS